MESAAGISSAQDREFSWELCEASGPTYVLCSGGTVFGSLRWLSGGDTITAEAAAYHWLFEGVRADVVNIRVVGAATCAAQLARGFRRATLTCQDGSIFHWFPQDHLATCWAIACERNAVLLLFGMPSIISDTVIRVSVRPEAEALPQLPLLLVVGGYLVAQLINELACTFNALATAPR